MYFVLFLLHIFIKKPIHVYVYFVCLCVYDEDSVDMIVYIHMNTTNKDIWQAIF